MAQISEITVEDLKSNTRIDAEFYQPFYLKIDELLTAQPYLIDLCKKITDFGAYSQMNFVNFVEEGLRFYRNQDVGEVFLKTNSPVYIDEDTYQKLSLKLEEGDILTPRVGTLGNAAIISKSDLPASANQNLAQVKPDTKKIDSFYLAVFLCTQFGKSQFLRFATGNVQPWLNLQQIGSIKVFLPNDEDQKRISYKSKQSLEKLYRSNDLYREAEQLLLQELGLKDFTPEWVAGYETNHDNILEVARMDAEYFQPRYEIVKDKIRAVEHDTLGNLVKPLKKGVEVGSEAYTDEGIPFLRVSNIEKLRIDNSSEQYIEEELYEELKDKFCPKKGEILLSKDGTPGIAYHLTEDVKTIISGGIIRLKTIAIEPEYLTLVLNSLIVQAQIEQDAGGALIKHWRPDQIKTTLIPILPKAVRERIVAMVQESFSALHESHGLLEQAKREVEEMIESKTTHKENSKLVALN